MEHADLVEHIRTQYTALRAAAVAAGPEAPVPSCPKWTVHDLVGHMAKVYGWVLISLHTAPGQERPRPEPGPESWDELLGYLDDRFTEMTDELADSDPDRPAWTFIGPKTYGFWARRQAHEAAIHRLDAEHALHGGHVPTLLFDPEFAADGVDEYLERILPYVAMRAPITREGRILFHAADAGRAWELRLTSNEPPKTGPTTDSATHEDATVAGTADAVYRAVWNRPSGAIVSGDRSLLDDLPRP